MTSPRLAISEREHGIAGAGRLYGDDTYDRDRLTDLTLVRADIGSGALTPSVTNVIGEAPMHHLTGWYGREAARDVAADHALTNLQRAVLIEDALASGADADVIVALADPAVPPAFFDPSLGAPTLDRVNRARTYGRGLIDLCMAYIKGGADGGEIDAHFGGHAKGRPPRIRSTKHEHYIQFITGRINGAEKDAREEEALAHLHRALGTDPTWAWVRAHLPAELHIPTLTDRVKPGQDTAGLAYGAAAATRSRDESARYGTRVHNLLEDFGDIVATRGIDAINPDDIPATLALLSDGGKAAADYRPEPNDAYHARAWVAWWMDAGVTDAIQEHTVFGETPDGLRYAGTADLLYRDPDGVGVVADYKTSKTLHCRAVALQMSAIAHADTPFPISKGYGVHVPRPEDAAKTLKFAKGEERKQMASLKDGYYAYEVTAEQMATQWEHFCILRAAWQARVTNPIAH